MPDAMLREIQRYRAYAPSERRTYLKIQLSNRLGFTKPKLTRIPNTAHSILFVCHGNIMRSPMCEALLKREFARFGGSFEVLSAGLNAIPGTPAHPWAISAASELGISLEKHRSQLLTTEMVDHADAIFAMDLHNQVQLLTRWPGSSRKIFMLAAYAGQAYRPVEIADPYYLGLEGTRNCYSILVDCCRNLGRQLSEQNSASVNGRV